MLRTAIALTGFLFVDLAGQGLPVNLPEFTLPPGATQVSAGANGIAIPGRTRSVPVSQPDGRSRINAHWRLATTAAATAITNHYLKQLLTLNWQETFRQDQRGINVVRFRTGSKDDVMVGLLTVVPFPDNQQTVVAIDLLRSKPPQRARGGGAGAAAGGAGFTIELRDISQSEQKFPGTIRLPATVTAMEMRGNGSGSPDFSQAECRLETSSSPQALMQAIEPQIVAAGWPVDARVGGSGSIHAITKFSAPKGGNSTAILYITPMAAVGEMDLLLMVVRNFR